ncbi:MAG: FKBP-type peptidyl-prolyl cis-trans isomerase [Paludibacteraceae bacterium]|jgi:FKBP-type peptidyl-prolyl cis-trans isomerase FklB|nr:FKBP-type peptidyl-prolyl cis-trans isomerase [Paludibacteraceae bacterium]
MDKISYALGLNIGKSLKKSGIKELNIEKFSNAVKNVLSNETFEISEEEARKILNDFFTQLQQEILEKNKTKGKQFLEENAKRENVIQTASGLQYEILVEGNGAKPLASDKVKVHYHGTLIDGTVFDSSIRRGEPATFGVTQVIQGWVEALQLMSVGAKWRLFIPHKLAYGAQGAGELIEPFSTLIFDVELLEIIK